jgi:Leucine-rich repeat (LRR) protein
MLLGQLLILIGLAGLGCGVQVQCPAPCICSATEATCEDSSLTDFPEVKFPSGLQKLVISRNNITKLDKLTIRKWMIFSLKQLNLSNNMINTINEESLMAQSGLEKLDLSRNKITNIPLKTFIYPPRLQWLSLANNREIQMAENTPLLESDSLQVLHLEYCNLRKISAANFEKIVKLEELHISHNKIETVTTKREGSVPSLMNIKILDISYNQLQQLPTEIMSLPNLEKLALRHNKLKVLCEMKCPHNCRGNVLTEPEIPAV